MRTLLASLSVLFLLVAATQASLVYSVSPLEEGRVLVKLTNTGSESERFLLYNTPFESDVFGSVLSVTDRVGRNANYIGKVAKRVSPAPESSYLTLAAGEEISAVINIHELYNVHEEGLYTVSARIPTTLRAVHGASASQFLQKSQERIFGVKAAKNTYSGCSNDEENLIEENRVLAYQYTSKSDKCLRDNSCDDYSTKWFAATNSVQGSNYETVTNTFGKLKPALSSLNVECHNSDCDASTFAFVFPTDPDQLIYICDAFWTTTDDSERPQTLIHEYSHYEVIGGTQDFAYGRPDCLTLALTDPDKAANNADNIGYFAVDVGTNLDISDSADTASNNSPNTASNNTPNTVSNNTPNSASNNSPNTASGGSPNSDAVSVAPLFVLLIAAVFMMI